MVLVSVKDKRKIELIADRLAKITGQKPAVRATKKAIATFKTRVGDPVGYQVTLRGKRMGEFLDRPRCTSSHEGLPWSYSQVCRCYG